MTKILRSKDKISRRLGKNLDGRPANAIEKRNTRPGQHGARRGKLSDYGIQLNAKQALKGYYNMQERQFRRFYAEARRRKGDTSQNLINLLERRLDAFVYRSKLAPTIYSARQLVSHGHIAVNDKCVDIASYILRDGDVVSLVNDNMKQNPVVLTAQGQAFRDVPEYISFDVGAMKGKFVRSPQLNDVPYPIQMQPNLVVEFYSR